MTSNLNKFLMLRKQWKTFHFDTATMLEKNDGWLLSFSYRMSSLEEEVCFSHQVDIQKDFMPVLDSQHPLIHHLVLQIGLMETINYWKLACPAELIVHPFLLDDEQVNWWHHLFMMGLGEFFYLNGIYGQVSNEDLLCIRSADGAPSILPVTVETDGILIPVGGGKDSVVTMELVKQLGLPSDVLIMNGRDACRTTAEAAGYGLNRQFVLTRRFDVQLMEMNRQGYLNGHVPFSAILAFHSLLVAALSGRKYIVLSNEGSANEPTVPGTLVNHQYSKSLDFETVFISHVTDRITPSIHYFSLLRPWSEARIAQAFSTMTAHHSLFKSCNRGSRENKWCCECPKCLFVFLLMAAYLGIEETARIYGENLLDKVSLSPLLEELLGVVPNKPFECVGTRAETIWSLDRIAENSSGRKDALLSWFSSIRDALPEPVFSLVEPELADHIPDTFKLLVLPEGRG